MGALLVLKAPRAWEPWSRRPSPRGLQRTLAPRLSVRGGRRLLASLSAGGRGPSWRVPRGFLRCSVFVLCLFCQHSAAWGVLFNHFFLYPPASMCPLGVPVQVPQPTFSSLCRLSMVLCAPDLYLSSFLWCPLSLPLGR